MKFLKRTGLFLLSVLFLSCGGSPTPVENSPTSFQAESSLADGLDTAIRETSDYLNKQLPAGNKLVILNIQSEFPALSEYIIDELIANTVNDRVFAVVDRQQLNTIRAELDFQMSGEVDDNTAQALGRMAGAQVIISGAVSKIGNLYRLRVRALNVQTAQIEGQFNRNIPDSPTIAALVRSQATGYSAGQIRTPATTVAPNGTVSPVPNANQGVSANTPVFPFIGRWRVTGRDSAIWTGSFLVIEEVEQERFNGYFEWYRDGVEYSGKEYYRGIYNSQDKTVILRGYRLVDQKGIALGRYEAILAANGYDFESGTWGGGGTWQAKKQN